MRPIVVYTRRFPSRSFHAITLFPFVFHNGRGLAESEVRHETVHLWQQMALLLVLFYLLYAVFWLYGVLRWRSARKAYRENPFERSAYRLEGEEDLTVKTMAFDWLHCFNRPTTQKP